MLKLKKYSKSKKDCLAIILEAQDDCHKRVERQSGEHHPENRAKDKVVENRTETPGKLETSLGDSISK